MKQTLLLALLGTALSANASAQTRTIQSAVIYHTPRHANDPRFEGMADEGLVTVNAVEGTAHLRFAREGTGPALEYVFTSLVLTQGTCSTVTTGTLVTDSLPGVIRRLRVEDWTQSICELHRSEGDIQVTLEDEEIHTGRVKAIGFEGTEWFLGRADFLSKIHALRCLPNEGSGMGLHVYSVIPVRHILDMRETAGPAVTIARVMNVRNGETTGYRGAYAISMELRNREIGMRDALNRIHLELVEAHTGVYEGELNLALGAMLPAFQSSDVTCRPLR